MWPCVNCNTSVTVTASSTTPGTSASVPDVPGTNPPDPVPEPTQLDGVLCTDPANPKIVLNYYPAINPWPQPAPDNFIIFWTVCNEGQQAQPPGQSYQFVINQQTINTQSPGAPAVQQISSNPIPVPALAACTCYTQEVGINMDVDPSVSQQPALAGLSASFPKITVGPTPPPQPPLAYNYQPEVVAPGLSAPATAFTFTIK